MSPTDISNIRSGARIDTGRNDRSSDSSDTSSTPVSAAVSDSVELTGTAQLLASFQTDLASIDAVDMAKVESIRQAIAQGTYQIDPQKIADSLLSLEGELA